MNIFAIARELLAIALWMFFTLVSLFLLMALLSLRSFRRDDSYFVWLKTLTKNLGEPDEDEVIGFRYAKICVERGRVRFKSLTRGTRFDAKAIAKCLDGEDHEAPGADCVCGFYAMKKAEALPGATFSHDTGSNVVLEVQLSRTVDYAAEGYRGGRQDVLHVWLPDICSVFRCYQPTKYFMEPAKSHSSRYAVLHPCCERHSRPTKRRLRKWKPPKVRFETQPVLTIQDLRNQLQTEVSFMEVSKARP